MVIHCLMIVYWNQRTIVRSILMMLVDRGESWANQLNVTVETARHRLPVLIGGFLVVDVNHVDFFHLAPFHSLSIQFGDMVGR